MHHVRYRGHGNWWRGVLRVMSAISQDVRMEMLIADVERCGAGAIDMFETLVENGESAEWAALCACRQPPGAKGTDRAFQDGQRRKMNRMDAENAEGLQFLAKRAGINTQGKYYVGGLGRPTDPKAWVATADDVIAIAKRDNLTIDGVVSHRGYTPELPPKSVGLADDIVDRFEREAYQADPALKQKAQKSRKVRQEVRERVKEKHGPPRK